MNSKFIKNYLQVLLLNNNRIKFATKNHFTSMANLRNIELYNNLLEKFEPERPLNYLTNLDLSENRIVQLSNLEAPSLKRLNLKNNSLAVSLN